MSKLSLVGEFVQFLKAEKKYLAHADRRRVRALRPADCVLAVERGRAVHLHAVLVPHRASSASRPTTTTRPPASSRTAAIVAAAQEERFTRKKHDAAFPSHAVGYCLREAGIARRTISTSSASTRSRSSSSTGCSRPTSRARRAGWQSYLMAMPLWLSEKLWMADDIRARARGLRRRGAVRRAPRVARGVRVLSVAVRGGRHPHDRRRRRVGDVVDRRRTRARRSRCSSELRFPHSLGLLYSAFTYFAGFRVNSGEYKVMGLAPYGEPQLRRSRSSDHLVEIRDDGSLWMNMDYFTYRPRADDDRRGVRAAVRRPGARAGERS